MQRIASFLVLLVASFAHADPAGPAPVVGGEPVQSSEWPDVVGVVGTHGTCTGTLIAPDVVLTAGHCIELAPHTVITHADDLATTPRDRIAVKWSRAYPNWPARYDIGVVMLQRMARVKPRAIATACLANQQLAAGTTLTTVGYGLVTPDASGTNTRLHAATLPLIDPFCESVPGCIAALRPNGEIAAGGRGTDTCFGDSGGPAYLATPSGAALVGVVSRGLSVAGPPCANGGIYVRADKVVAWIESVTERDLERVPCARPSDEADEADDLEAEDDDANGCATHGGGGIAVALALAGLLARTTGRRRRSSRTM